MLIFFFFCVPFLISDILYISLGKTEKHMKIGYARVSTLDQNLDLQLDELKSFGCKKIFHEKASAKKKDRPQLTKMLDELREGDTVVVWKLDRLGRSLKDLVELISTFQEKGVDFISMKESIDTTTPTGLLVFHIFASLAEFERAIIRDRTMAGLKAARSRGRVGGQPKGIRPHNLAKAPMIASLYQDKKTPVLDILKQFNISRTTLYKLLEHEGIKVGSEAKRNEN